MEIIKKYFKELYEQYSTDSDAEINFIYGSVERTMKQKARYKYCYLNIPTVIQTIQLEIDLLNSVSRSAFNLHDQNKRDIYRNNSLKRCQKNNKINKEKRENNLKKSINANG